MDKYKYTLEDGTEIIFRLMNLDETGRFLNGVRMTQDPFAEEFIFNIITDNKYDTDSLDAGVIPIVVFLSFSMSGIFKDQTAIPDRIDETREALDNNAYYLMYSVIVRAQPGYTLEMLKNKSANEILELFVFSEIVLGKKQVDTDKARESVAPKSSKGIKAVTKEEIAGLQDVLSSMEFDGVLQDEYRF